MALENVFQIIFRLLKVRKGPRQFYLINKKWSHNNVDQTTKLLNQNLIMFAGFSALEAIET